MSSEQTESTPDRIPLYERLAAATPAERTEVVLGLLRDNPQHALALPVQNGVHAVLDEVDLTPLAPGVGILAQGGSALPTVGLRNADLQGVSLRKANLRGLDLSNANLDGALLGEANLGLARLEGANLKNADMAGANLRGAALGEANLQGTMLEEADLRGVSLRFANLREAVLEHANLKDADLRGANLEAAVLTGANLQGADMEEANLSTADMEGANLQGAVLKRANLQASRLRGADLREASLAGANLRGAFLNDARLQEVDLSQCDITHIHLSGARLQDARFQREQIGGHLGEELAGEFGEARKGYLALERAFQDLGDPDGSSWAYRRRRRVQKREALGRARAARADGRWHTAIADYTQFASDQLVEWLCDYGESIPRVLGSLLLIYVVFTVAYGVTGSVEREDESPTGTVRVMTQNPVDLAIFSLLAMTTGSIGIQLLPRGHLALTLVGIHVFLGVALIGLLGFVLGNRIRR